MTPGRGRLVRICKKMESLDSRKREPRLHPDLVGRLATMKRKARTVLLTLLLLLFVLEARAQSPASQTPGSDISLHPSSQPAPASTLDLGREAQFISLMHARDAQVSYLAELKRILSFHDGGNASFQR